MIYPLPGGRGDRERAAQGVAPLYAALDDRLATRAVLEGAASGSIYVDDLQRPTAAAVISGHNYYLAGSPDVEAFQVGLRRLITQVIYPQAQAGGQPVLFNVHYTPGWEGAIERILEGKYPMRDRRLYLERRPAGDDPPPTPLPAGYRLALVERQLLDDISPGSRAVLIEEMCSERASVEEFLERSFGYCALHGAAVVGWCLSEYNVSDRCEVGIETAAPHRRRGVGAALASALVAHSAQQGIERVGWHCWASNAASSATARKAGFGLVREYPVYFAWFDELDNLAANGNVRLAAGDPQGAVEWFERAIWRGQDKGWVYWRAASAYALVGQPDKALHALRNAIVRGYGDLEKLHTTEALASLQGSSGWGSLMEELEQRSMGA